MQLMSSMSFLHRISSSICLASLSHPVLPGKKTIGRAIFDAFSGVNVTVDDTIVEGDTVVERHTAHAVHSGEFNVVNMAGR
jgi:predicted ester cyclase